MRASSLVVVVSLFPGCVSLSSYDELQRDHEQTKTRLAEVQLESAARAQQQEIAERKLHSLTEESEHKAHDLQTALAAEQRKRAELQAAQEALNVELTRVQSVLTQTQGELAQVVKDRSALKGSVDEMRQALDELSRRKAEADRRIAEFKGLLARFQTLIDAGKLKVKIIDGRMVVALASDILFSSGSASLSKEGKARVGEVAALLAQLAGRKFQVEGHTDNVPIRTEQFPSNWELASARALTVLKTMVDAGMPADRVSAASFGDSKPAVPNDTPDGKAQNRRIEIVVVPDLSSLPGFDELQRVGH